MKLRHLVTVITLILATAVSIPASAQTPSFDGLGQLPGGQRSVPFNVNADGAVVVGYGANLQGDYEAFRWTAADGMTGLGFLDPDALLLISTATSVVADGTRIIGSCSYGFGFGDFEAVVWEPDGSITQLGFYSDPYYGAATQASDVSSDGSVIVGIAGSPADRCISFRWTSEDGIVNLGTLPGGYSVSRAEGISDDGTIIVGGDAVQGYQMEAYRWTEDGGMVGLGVPAGFDESYAYDISGDGTAIVGYCSGDMLWEAFRWTEPGGIVALGGLPGGFESEAYATNDDGNIVVGLANDAAGDYHAFVWAAQTGLRKLADVLQSDVGLDLAGWELYSANAISSDGSTIVGEGTNPAGEREGWIVTLGDEPPCIGDLNSDGLRDLGDLAALLASYDINDGGDLDGDGDTDLADLSTLLAVYDMACVW